MPDHLAGDDSGRPAIRGAASWPARQPTPRYAVFGAPVDTGNLGVSALATATLACIVERHPDAELTVFDFAFGAESASMNLPTGQITYTRRGAYRSRRFHRAENLRSMYLAARFAPERNPNVRVIDGADAVLDISGGDSFTDLYGPKRFVLVTTPKLITLERRRPLHLLPQTFGPFGTARSRKLAARIVRGAATAWARDERSFDVLRELLGGDFDARRHRRGVDVAFLLPRVEPVPQLVEQLGLTQNRDPLVGINVSGLLSNEPEVARRRFGLSADYPTAMEALVRRFLERTEARVLLVPHVSGAPHECDHTAGQRLEAAVNDASGRVVSVPKGLDAMVTKAVIGNCDWFVGARMHSTIAALSQAVPSAAVAYSDKTAGVFATCNLGDEVVDARRLAEGDLVDALWERWERRSGTGGALADALPGVFFQASAQMDSILGVSDD